jgi:outer membrane receptor for ferrienterochelin and colicins
MRFKTKKDLSNLIDQRAEVTGHLTAAINSTYALKMIPTARFENNCQNCRLNEIQLLGLGTDYTANLFDGAPLYSGLAEVYGADLFPSVFIDRIEVVKGGSSVLYEPAQPRTFYVRVGGKW